MRVGRAPSPVRILRGAALLLGLLFCLVLGYLAAGLAGALWPAGGSHATEPGRGRVIVGLLAGPIHYDFLLPATPEVRARFAFAEGAGVAVTHPGTRWIVAGWGAEAFYTTVGTYADINLTAVRRGILGDRAVLRLGVAGQVDPVGIDWIDMSDAQFAGLVDSIASEVPGGAAPVLTGDRSAFFPARGPFHLLRTCNVWVGERLRGAGLPFGRWTPTTRAVQLSIDAFGLRAASG